MEACFTKSLSSSLHVGPVVGHVALGIGFLLSVSFFQCPRTLILIDVWSTLRNLSSWEWR